MRGIKSPDTNKTCKNCKWRSDEFTSVCVCDSSDHLADFVEADCVCEEWEEKDEQTDRR